MIKFEIKISIILNFFELLRILTTNKINKNHIFLKIFLKNLQIIKKRLFKHF
jgi:hypothetical protein